MKAKRGSPSESKKGSAPRGELSRRRFGQLAMLGLAGGALMPAELLLASTNDNGRVPEGQKQESAALSARAQAEVDAKLKAIFAEYGDRLSEEKKKPMRGIVSNHVQMLESVRAFPLHNPDAPATVLKLVTRNENRAAMPESRAGRGGAGKSSRRNRQGAR
ncbi:MAG: hypothetical protein KGL59_10800 [Acidobacteriota bacterium]|nr:hypothetical protein [Acidobacteriota bacterium]